MDDQTDLTPEIRALREAAGVPAALSDGREWLLADGGLCNELDGLRDRLDDDARLTGQVELSDVREAALALLLANYELTGPEAVGLVLGADPQALTDATSAAMFGDASRKTYTSWAASALLANGLDPAAVPGHLRAHVLAHLEAAGRCVPRSKFIDSAVAAPRLAAMRARAARVVAEKAPEADE